MKPVSIVLLFFVLYLFMFKPRTEATKALLMLLVIFEIYVNVGVFATIGSLEVHNSDIIWLVLLVVIGEDLFTTKHNLRQLMMISLLVFCILLSIVVEGLTNIDFSRRSVIVGVRLICFALLYSFIESRFDRNELSFYFCKSIVLIQKTAIAVLIIEFIIKSVTHSNIWNEMVLAGFGFSANQVTWLIMRGGLYSLQGFCKEPSHLAFALFYGSMCDLLFLKNNKEAMKIMTINVVLLIISGSFSSILFIVSLAIAYLGSTSLSPGKLMIIAGSVVIACAFVVFASKLPITRYYLERISSARNFAYLNMNTSEGIRLKGIYYSIMQFLGNPFAGVGLGNNIYTGAIPSILAAGGSLVCLPYFLLPIGCTEGVRINAGLIIAMVISLLFTMDIGIMYCGSMALLVMFMVACPSIQLQSEGMQV